MPKRMMFNKPDITKDVAVPGLKMMKWSKPGSFKVEIDFDEKIFKKIEKDDKMLLDMNTAAQKAYKQTCDALKSKASAFDTLIVTMVDKNAPKPAIEKQLAGLNKSIENDVKVGEVGAEHAIMEVWTKYSSKNADYKKYKIKIFTTILGSTAALATSIGLMAATPFTGGASAALGIIGMVQSAVTIAKQSISAALEIEKAQAILKKELGVVEQAAKTLVGRKANEYTAIVVTTFLGHSQPSIKQCDEQLDIIKQKLHGIDVNLHGLTVKLNGILDEQEKLKTEFLTEAKSKLAKHPSKDAPAQAKKIEAALETYLKPNYDAVVAAIEKTGVMNERVTAAEETTKELEKRVEPLVGLRGVDEKILENILYFAQVPLGALNGNAIATKASDLVSGLVPVATGIVFDKITSKVLTGTFLA